MRTLGLVLVVALSLSLAACVPAPPERARDVVARGPLFETDAEALAAAEKVYREYSAVLRLISSGASEDANRLRALSTTDWFAIQSETLEQVRVSGRRTVGESPLVEFRFQRREPPDLIAYACHDYSHLEVKDASGTDVTPTRDRFALFEVTFSETSGSILVAKNELWKTSDSCSS